MARDRFKIEHLCAFGSQRGKQPRLARAGESAHQTIRKPLRQRWDRRHDMTSIRAITTVKLPRAPADFGQHMDQCTTALTAAPAIDEGHPVSRFVARVRVDEA